MLLTAEVGVCKSKKLEVIIPKSAMFKEPCLRLLVGSVRK